VLVLVETALIVGLSLITSALNVSFRDLAPVVTLGLQIWLFVTPITYPLSMVRDAVARGTLADWLWPIYLLNPMVGLIDSFRATIAHGQAPDWGLFGLSTAMSVIILAVAYLYFKSAERVFADII
jgi:lipopolysaccharide transport system permease protein